MKRRSNPGEVIGCDTDIAVCRYNYFILSFFVKGKQVADLMVDAENVRAEMKPDPKGAAIQCT